MSTGLECDIIERNTGEWYYILQNWDCPAHCWDWREYATAYGPFATEEGAEDHLRRNHANPGGYSVYSVSGATKDAVLEGLFDKAIAPSRRHSMW